MTLTLEKYEDSSVHWWLEELEKAVDENKQRESERKKAARLDEREADYDARLAFGYRPDKDRRDGGIWGRRSSDRTAQEAVSILNRMQEPREIQGSLWGVGSGSGALEHGTSFSDQDESS